MTNDYRGRSMNSSEIYKWKKIFENILPKFARLISANLI